MWPASRLVVYKAFVSERSAYGRSKTLPATLTLLYIQCFSLPEQLRLSWLSHVLYFLKLMSSITHAWLKCYAKCSVNVVLKTLKRYAGLPLDGMFAWESDGKARWRSLINVGIGVWQRGSTEADNLTAVLKPKRLTVKSESDLHQCLICVLVRLYLSDPWLLEQVSVSRNSSPVISRMKYRRLQLSALKVSSSSQFVRAPAESLSQTPSGPVLHT